MFKKEPTHDAEFDVENTPCIAIDRRGEYTVVGFLEKSHHDEYIKCTIEKHNNIVARFRNKLDRLHPTVDVI